MAKTMQDYGWNIKIIRLPKKKWYSLDDRVVFNNEEDCEAYDYEPNIIEERKIQEKEEDEWVEEYYRRRCDPFWKSCKSRQSAQSLVRGHHA